MTVNQPLNRLSQTTVHRIKEDFNNILPLILVQTNVFFNICKFIYAVNSCKLPLPVFSFVPNYHDELYLPKGRSSIFSHFESEDLDGRSLGIFYKLA